MATYDHLGLEELWTNAGGPEASADTAAAIAQAESVGNSNAIDNTAYPSKPGYHAPSPGALPEYSIGLWQINLLAHPSYTEAEMLVPLSNARAAVSVSGGGLSFGAWSTYTHGQYLQYLSGTSGGVNPAGTPPVGTPAGALSGWHQLTHALAKGLIGELHSSDHMVAAANRRLARAGRR